MLYTESKQYLIDKLKAAGIKSKPFTTEKALEKSQESHIGAVLFERETFTRNGSKKRYGSTPKGLAPLWCCEKRVFRLSQASPCGRKACRWAR